MLMDLGFTSADQPFVPSFFSNDRTPAVPITTTFVPFVNTSARASAFASHSVTRHQVVSPASSHWLVCWFRRRGVSPTLNSSFAFPFGVNVRVASDPRFPVSVMSAMVLYRFQFGL
jgi:hypothetical protein